MFFTIIQAAGIIILAFIVITQVIRPAIKGDRIFPAFRKPETPNKPGNGGSAPGRDDNETKDVQ